MSKKGFTLVELLIAMVVGLIIMAAIYGMMNLSQNSSSAISRKVQTQQDARAVLDLMAMEIRMASYNPTLSTTVWSTVPACASMEGFAGSAATSARKGIQIAKDNSILVAMDLGTSDSTTTLAETPDGVIYGVGAAPNEYIYYSYDSANGQITRNVSCGGNETILGGDGSGTTVVNNDAGQPLFQYFNSAGTDISSTVKSSPNAVDGGGGIRDVRRIRINIVVDVENQDAKIKVSRKTHSTDILVRNHALN